MDKQILSTEYSLDHFLSSPLQIGNFLRLATLMTGALRDLHHQGLIHKDIKPQNIFVNSDQTAVKIGGLGLATRLTQKPAAATPLQMIEGTLAYMSPEQTGKMNRAIDYRSDFYSLGIVFYEMLTGTLPFEANTPVEWVYCHVARPPALDKLAQHNVPVVLIQIITKLLEKIADDRYQTADGLLYDLEFSQKEWNLNKKIETFLLGKKDHPGKLLIPQKLYGREREVATLLETFNNVVQTGSPKLVLISGYSGIGKSTLVNELHRPIITAQGFFISGKFDQYKRDIPYFTFVQAFNNLILNLLTQSEDQIQNWKQKLKTAMGDNAQLIVDVIPKVELLIGKQRPVAELPPMEAQNRFRNVFLNFIKVFSRAEHPLTLFLDDLQWADAASLLLLKDLVTGPDDGHLFVVGAYRDNEIFEDHPLALMISGLRKANAPISDIVLGPLSQQNLTAFIADALSCSQINAKPLSDLIYEKTAGNPFFVIQFLTTLFEEQLIYFDSTDGSWQWNLVKIKSKEFTTNVLDLVIRKIKRLSEPTQDALKKAACLGNTVEIEDLKIVFGFTEEQIWIDLWPAMESGILAYENNTYKFLHDRLHEAVYALIPESKRATEHLRIARAKLSHFSQKKIEDRVFDIVGHLNLALDLQTGSVERVQTAQLNLLAAKRAQAAAAFGAAANYCASGLRLFEPEAWSTQYDLLFSLGLVRAKCELATGQVELAEQIIQPLLGKARQRVDQAAAQQVQINIYTARGQSEKALEESFTFLRLYNLEISLRPSLEFVEKFDLTLWDRMNQMGLESIANLPRVQNKDKDIEGAVEVLADLLPSAYFIDIHLHRLVACYITDLTLRYGMSQLSPMGFAAYGFELAMSRRYSEANKFGRLAHELVHRHQFVSCRTKVVGVYGATISPWTNSFSTSIDILREGFSAENGDIIFASLCRFNAVAIFEESGKNLDEVQSEAVQALQFIHSRGYSLIGDGVITVQKFVRDMKGVVSLDDPLFGESQLVERMKNNPIPQMMLWYALFKFQTHIFYNDLTTALSESVYLKASIFHLRGQQPEMEFVFFYSLTLTGLWSGAGKEQQEIWMEELKKYDERLRAWSELNPENFLSRAKLVAGEIARIEKRDAEAQHLFDEAIKSAQKNNCTHMEALAFERAAQFYKNRGFDLIAATYIREAYSGYIKWGASGKVKQLEQIYSELRSLKQSAPLTSVFSNTMMAQPEQFDFFSVIKASQAISSQIVLDKLILTLLQTVLEHSNAQKVVLALGQDGNLSLEAKAQISDNGLASEILESVPLDSSKDVPVSIVRFVQRIKEPVILDDASIDAAQFSDDEYIARIQPKSVLCLPILRGNELLGILYFENNISRGVFLENRLNVLNLIASQAAISLQNAKFYEQLQKSVQVRDDFISIAAHELRTPLTPLRMSLDILKMNLEKISAETLPKIDLLMKAFKNTDNAFTRMTRLTEDLLDVSRIRFDRLILNLEKNVDLSKLVHETIEHYDLELQRAHCPIKLKIIDEVMGTWDSSRITQVFENILTNAIKYGAGKPIEVTVKKEQNSAILIVTDQGIGIDKTEQTKIFQRFARAVSVNSYGGLGLGLYISREVVVAHGGKIWVESEIGKGATFVVELPLHHSQG